MTRGRTNPARDRANAGSRKPKPPAHLTDAEGAIWTKVCKDQSGEWCEVAACGRLLVMYCVAVAYYDAVLAAMHIAALEHVDSAAAWLEASSGWQKKLADLEPRVYNLETKLRLTPQSRQRADGPQGAPANPWDDPDGETG